MHFYEIHEADEELLLGVTLAHEERFSPPEFLAMVEEARGRVIESFEEDSLVEAIAQELERAHGFYPALDRALQAAVSVSTEEGETALLPAGDQARAAMSDDEDEALEIDHDLQDAEDLLAGRSPRRLRTVIVDLELDESAA